MNEQRFTRVINATEITARDDSLLSLLVHLTQLPIQSKPHESPFQRPARCPHQLRRVYSTTWTLTNLTKNTTDNMAGGLALPPMNASTQYTPEKDELDSLTADSLFQDMMNDPTLTMGTDFDMDATAAPADLFGQPRQIVFDAPRQPQEVIPMQPQMSIPQQIPRFGTPDLSMGPSFHPMVGWYYPTPAPFPYPTSQASQAAFPQSYTPAISTSPPTSAMPSGMSTPVSQTIPSLKRKYGPAAYLEEKAKQRATGNPAMRAMSIEAKYTSKAKQRDDRANGVKANNMTFYRKSKAPSIVQACICTDKQANKIKRPKNAFILYRSAHAKQIMRQNGHNNNQDVSKQAAASWKAESEKVKKQFHELAEQEKQRHTEMYPDYKYAPGTTSRNKFGSATCKCGAYDANIAAMNAKQNHGGSKNADNESEQDDVDEYLPPRSTPLNQQQVPTAQMTIPDPETSGFSTPAQQAEAVAYVGLLKRKRRAAADYSALHDKDQSIAKRRSPRIERMSVFYAGPDENDIYNLTQVKRRPSPIITTENTAISPVQIDDSPARNTRSRSRTFFDGLDFTMDMDTLNSDFNFEEFFADHVPKADDDTIAVAARRPSMRSRKSAFPEGSPTKNPAKSSSPTKSYSLRRRS